jgi:hypothetical protein
MELEKITGPLMGKGTSWGMGKARRWVDKTVVLVQEAFLWEKEHKGDWERRVVFCPFFSTPNPRTCLSWCTIQVI